MHGRLMKEYQLDSANDGKVQSVLPCIRHRK